jgi:hypothetical protein
LGAISFKNVLKAESPLLGGDILHLGFKRKAIELLIKPVGFFDLLEIV